MSEALRALAAYARLKSQASYRSQLRSNVRALWSGEWDIFQFFDSMRSAIENEFTRAWHEGLASVGLSPEDMNLDERLALNNMIFSEINFIYGFGEEIEANSKANGGELAPLLVRAEKWVLRYLNVKNQALQMARNDPVLEWVTHAAESCVSCLKLNGQRRRSSVWARLDLRPQHPTKLECMRSAGGVDVCKCELTPTEQPPSRGRLPKV